MRIAKSALVDPAHNEVYGVAAVALSFFVFAYSSRFGQISILAYYGVWFLLLLADYRRALGNYLRYLWIFGFALFCFISAFWSPAFGISLRTAIQYLTHLVCALIAMRTISVLTLTRGAIVGTAIVLLFSMLFGTYLYDAIDGSYSFVGAFSSKNQLGFYASLGLLFAASYLLIWRQKGLWLVASGGVGLLSAYCLLASQSATSAITTAGVLALCLGYMPVAHLAPNHRKLLVAGLVVIAVVAVIGALQVGAVDAVLGIFGKDSTLTGRTYLWQQGIEAIRENPILGTGYQGYWVPGFADAERLWDDFFITARSGFHFHNTFIEVAVETGLVGLALLCMIMLTNVFGHLSAMLSRDRDPGSTLLCALSILLLIRAFVEVDVLFPYQIGSFLMFYAAGRLTLRRKSPALTYPSRPRRTIIA
ncbi:O-antigen ligase family protein [Neorhizobium galegae]|uniref:O-antigen ligase family protein n=1 Tax=Neorhizobium galegae TaxID=399 RepID=UPI0006216856|nr:O-antigen ligase [Neorhizobium galegae]MCQ1766596.1 O-antigen ligase family protein [Neorhizobium galegae]MCQ1845510.1 O-antigen ligase family protein [Neorhizobium galegae]CDZ36044.1 Exopolysaccharide production protein ExoQ [Neorhizobium galegae bv. officinalis]